MSTAGLVFVRLRLLLPPSVDPLPPDPLAQKTDAELLYLAQHAHRYPAAVGQSAVRELQRRGLIPTDLPSASTSRPAAPEPAPAESWYRVAGQFLRAVLVPRAGFFVTPLLLNANLLAYALLGLAGINLLAPASPDLVAWGANVSGLTLPAQPWRLLTSVFLHGGPAHLLLNMGSLLLVGLLAEAQVGRWRWLLTYLLSGAGGSLVSLWWHVRGVSSVGASGAIFGLYGLLLGLLLIRALPANRAERAGIIGILLYFALSSFVGGLEGVTTDNAAHIGGLITGVLCGFVSAALGRRSPQKP